MAFSTIDKSLLYQNPVLYTGNASTQSITGVGFQSDLLWIKCRGAVENQAVYDSVRGDSGQSSGYYELEPNNDAAEAAGAWNTLVSAIGSDGFSLGNNDQVNTASTFVAWSWKAGTTTGIAGSPTITPSSYSFNATSGFSIIKYVGNGTADATIPHGLSTAPKMVIIKNLTTQEGWVVGHQGIRGVGLGWTKIMKLNTNAGETTSSAYFGNVAPSATLVTIGTDGGVNTNTDNYIAYCFSEVVGYSKMGSYVGNNNTNGTFTYTGFKPSFVMIKGTYGDWWGMQDDKRDIDNVVDKTLYANENDTEYSGANYYIDFLSNGFKIRTTHSGMNGNGSNYIYTAFGQPIISNSGVCATAR